MRKYIGKLVADIQFFNEYAPPVIFVENPSNPVLGGIYPGSCIDGIDAFPCIKPPFRHMIFVFSGLIQGTDLISDSVVHISELSIDLAAGMPYDPIYGRDEGHRWKDNRDLMETIARIHGVPLEDQGQIFGSAIQEHAVCATVYKKINGGVFSESSRFVYTITREGTGNSSMYAEGGPLNPSTYFYSGMVLQALSLLHCKNISLQEENPARLPRKDRKERSITGVRYKLLTVNPMKAQSRRPSETGPAQKTTPLHICRGHFKNYTNRGLFGKLKGLYWWESCARGSSDNGSVVKDYRLLVPSKS